MGKQELVLNNSVAMNLLLFHFTYRQSRQHVSSNLRRYSQHPHSAKTQEKSQYPVVRYQCFVGICCLHLQVSIYYWEQLKNILTSEITKFTTCISVCLKCSDLGHLTILAFLMEDHTNTQHLYTHLRLTHYVLEVVPDSLQIAFIFTISLVQST
jgi:hypothetical protein